MASNAQGMSWSVLVSGRLWLAAFMGFAAGLPLLLTLTVLQAWLSREDVDLGTIGLFGLVSLPYNIKFLWAPLLDRYKPLAIGRRRGWLLIAQLALTLSIVNLGLQDPGSDLWGVVAACFLLTFFSATQDSVIDAYRRETLADSEQGLGASFYTYGYRLGMLLAGAGGLIMADIIGFRGVYFVIAGVMFATIGITMLAPEPPDDVKPPVSIKESFVQPFFEFFTRGGGGFNNKALLILVFIVAYKLGDNMAQHMAIPFYLEIGFTLTQIGAIAKVFGFAGIMVGVFLGGGLTLQLGLFRTLLIVGVLQGLSTACFAILTQVGNDLPWLTVVIAFENLSAGMGTAVLLAFMAALTNRQFTATQFALLAALANLPRAILVAPTGFFASFIGWPQFFTISALVAIPGLLLLLYLRPWIDTALAPSDTATAPSDTA